MVSITHSPRPLRGGRLPLGEGLRVASEGTTVHRTGNPLTGRRRASRGGEPASLAAVFEKQARHISDSGDTLETRKN